MSCDPCCSDDISIHQPVQSHLTSAGQPLQALNDSLYSVTGVWQEQDHAIALLYHALSTALWFGLCCSGLVKPDIVFFGEQLPDR